MAVCHWKAGQPALAEQAYRSQVQRLDTLAEVSATEPRRKLFVLTDLINVASTLRQAGKRDAALAVAHEAATLAARVPTSRSATCNSPGSWPEQN